MRTFFVFLAACGGGAAKPPPSVDAPPPPIDASHTIDTAPIVPIALAMNEALPRSIAIYGGEVFWSVDGPGQTTTSGQIRKATANGAVVTLADHLDFPRSVVAGMGLIEPTVFWTSFGFANNVQQIAASGAPPLSSTTANDVTYAVALGGASVFIGTRSSVQKKTVANSGTPMTLASGYFNGVTAIASDGSIVAYGAPTSSSQTEWAIFTIAPDGGTPTMLSSSASQTIRAIAFDAQHVYWVEGTELRRVPRTGGVFETVKSFPLDDEPAALALADGLVFVATNQAVLNPSGATGRILSIDPTTRAEHVFATQQAEPQAIAVDAGAVYWANRGLHAEDGAIMRIAR